MQPDEHCCVDIFHIHKGEGGIGGRKGAPRPLSTMRMKVSMLPRW